MKKLFLLTLIIGSLAQVNLVQADSKYNPYTGKWENRSSDDVLKWNPYKNTWNYEDPDSSLDYNPWSNEWDYTR